MKKFYTTLVVVLMATMGFAQVTPLERPQMPSPIPNLETARELPPMDMKKMQQTRAGAGAFEYSYLEALFSMTGETLNTSPAAILSDSLVRTPYADGSGGTKWQAVQRYSVAAIYDFTSPDWTTFYRYYEDVNGNRIPVPDFGQTRNFNVDSVAIQFLYQWGSEVPANTVDTLVVSIAAVEGLPYFRIYATSNTNPLDTTWYYSWAEIPWDRYGDAVFTSNIPGATNVKYYKHKHLLTINDTTNFDDENSVYRKFYTPLPESFRNLTNNKQVVVAYAFKSGSRNPNVAERYTTDSTTKQINLLRALYIEDPRPEFAHPAGSNAWSTPQLLADRNLALDAMSFSMEPDIIWTNNYVNTSEWFGNLNRPIMYVAASCNDCEWINVKEMEQRNISIRPNPATENFHLDLEAGGAAQVELYNMMGQLMHKELVNDQTVTVNVNNFNSGMYILRVVQDGKVYTAKVMVK